MTKSEAFKLLELTEKKPDDYTIQEIRKAYLRLALQNHPDKNSQDIDGATVRFKAIQEAYDSIISDRKRQTVLPEQPLRNHDNADIEWELFERLYQAINQYNIEELEKALEALNALPLKQQTSIINKHISRTLIGLMFEQGLGKELIRYIDTLLRAGADVNLKDQQGMTAIHKLSQTRKLIRKSNEANNHTALQVATQQTATVLAERLLANGADINALDKSGWTPLFYAASARNREMVAWLISKGANVNATSEFGQTPLELAVLFPSYKTNKDDDNHESAEIVSLLLAHGAKVDQRDCHGRTILHRAIASNKLVIDILLKSGVEINAVDDNLDTALHIAVSLNLKSIVQLLIEHGCDLTLKNFHINPITKKVSRQTPYELAMERGYVEIAALVKPAIEVVLDKAAPTTSPDIKSAKPIPADSKERQELQRLLKHYIDRTELHKKESHIDFEFGFWFLKKSRAHNREANYYLASQLYLLLEDPEKSIQTIFDKKNMDKIRNLKHPTLGIHSTELNDVIKRAHTITENAACKPRFMR